MQRNIYSLKDILELQGFSEEQIQKILAPVPLDFLENKVLQSIGENKIQENPVKFKPYPFTNHIISNSPLGLFQSTNTIAQNPVLAERLLADVEVHPEPNYVKDLAAVATLLANHREVERLLRKLELELLAYVRSNSDPKMKALNEYENGRPWKHHKLFTNYIRQWAKENGFNGLTKVESDLSAHGFYQLLKNKQLIKDKMFRSTKVKAHHGEFTHFLQWWCIVEYYKETKFLSSTAADLYAWIGSTKPDDLVWFKTCEVPDYKTVQVQLAYDSKSGYGNVFRLNALVHGESARIIYPALNIFIRGREAKTDKPYLKYTN